MTLSLGNSLLTAGLLNLANPNHVCKQAPLHAYFDEAIRLDTGVDLLKELDVLSFSLLALLTDFLMVYFWRRDTLPFLIVSYIVHFNTCVCSY